MRQLGTSQGVDSQQDLPTEEGRPGGSRVLRPGPPQHRHHLALLRPPYLARCLSTRHLSHRPQIRMQVPPDPTQHCEWTVRRQTSLLATWVRKRTSGDPIRALSSNAGLYRWQESLDGGFSHREFGSSRPRTTAPAAPPARQRPPRDVSDSQPARNRARISADPPRRKCGIPRWPYRSNHLAGRPAVATATPSALWPAHRGTPGRAYP
jgi:hypothetical protein